MGGVVVPIAMRLLPVLALTLGLTGAFACTRVEGILDGIPARAPATPHEAYLASLIEAGLDTSALADRWREAATRALDDPMPMEPPFEEIAFYPAEEPTAASYRIMIDRGQSIRISYTAEPADVAGVFLDVYRLEAAGAPTHVANALPGARALEFEPSRAGEFLVRVQVELLRDVRVRLRVVKAAVLAFPVGGRDTRAIQSSFGAVRDAGRREHDGVDIFAPRGTPVLAASAGIVSRVGDQRLGGRVVWVRDARRGMSQYYAHLDRQLVERGQRVQPGDTIGLVGNTGNARTTPPHLHFGLYQRGEGPIDPFGFLRQPPGDPPRLRVDTIRLGEWVRTRSEARGSVGADGDIVLEPYTVVRVLGAAGTRLRVRLPDGHVVLLAGGVEALDMAIEEAELAAGVPMLTAPSPGALAASRIREDGTFPVVGRFLDYLLVRPPDGRDAWVEAPR